MFEQDTITHHIQKYIIGVLIHQKYARFRDLKPPRVDSNLYSYHLKKLLKQKIIQKIANPYTLYTLLLQVTSNQLDSPCI